MNQFLLPPNADLDQWGNFLTASVLVMGAAIVGFFIFYAMRYYKHIAITKTSDIYQQHKPWIWCIYYIIGANLLLDLVIGLIMVSDRSFDAVVSELGIGAIGGVLAFAAFWIVSWVGVLHARVKYVPFLKRLTIRRR